MLYFHVDSISQKQDGFEKNWTLPELLESPNPFSGEPLPARNAAMQKAVEMATEHFAELSETARLRYDFWKQFLPQRIEAETFAYTVKISNTYKWELSINTEGLFYRDISGHYSPMPGTVYEQLFSDFWFYGPLMPLPDLHTRKWIVAKIRNAFLQAGSSASYQHFGLIEYPEPAISPREWTEGDADASDYVIIRDYGIETGRTNWHDGLVYCSFLSFEHFLHLPISTQPSISAEARTEIRDYLNQAQPTESSRTAASSLDYTQEEHYTDLVQKFMGSNAESKRLFMASGGLTHYIYLDGDGDRYHATAAEEAEWRKELLENYTKRIQEETDGVSLSLIARNMQLNGAQNVEAILLEAAENASPKAKQGLAQALLEVFNSNEGAEILISLLELEKQDSYWRDYVFNAFFRAQDNQKVQNFLIQCLQGDQELWFKKAVDVLRAWAAFGEKALNDAEMLNTLTWEAARSANPHFQKALDQIIPILTRK